MQGMMWPESMPPEVVQDLAEKQQAGKQKAAAAQQVAETPEETPRPPRQRGHLRVIK
jgi:stringent starvation protein B